MGHSATRAALTYLHATNERQGVVADAVGALARTAMRKASKGKDHAASGTVLARRGEESSK